jgi:hypothetical protein
MKFTTLTLAMIASVSVSKLKDLLLSIQNGEKDTVLKQMKERIE